MERAVPSVKWKTMASAACIPRRDSTSPYSMAATVFPTASRTVCSLSSRLGGPIILGCSPLLACWLSIPTPSASCDRPLPSDTAHLTLAWPCPPVWEPSSRPWRVVTPGPPASGQQIPSACRRSHTTPPLPALPRSSNGSNTPAGVGVLTPALVESSNTAVPESRIGKEDGEGDLTDLTVLTPEGYDDVKGPENLHSIRDGFKSLHYYRGTASALKTFREDPSDHRFEYLCRAACREAPRPRPLGGVFRRDSRRGRAARRSFAAERGGLILFRFFVSKRCGFSSQTSHQKKGRGYVPTISPCQGGGFAAGCRSWPSELLRTPSTRSSQNSG
jgi:hypothetical protein